MTLGDPAHGVAHQPRPRHLAAHEAVLGTLRRLPGPAGRARLLLPDSYLDGFARLLTVTDAARVDR